MPRLFIAALPVLAAISTLAQAAEPNFDLRRKACPTVAQQAGYAYAAKHESGNTFVLNKDLQASALSPLYVWSVNYAQNRATGIDDAVHRATEMCLRNVERVNEDAKAGKMTRVEDLE